jgi:hypothetical protein
MSLDQILLLFLTVQKAKLTELSLPMKSQYRNALFMGLNGVNDNMNNVASIMICSRSSIPFMRLREWKVILESRADVFDHSISLLSSILTPSYLNKIEYR